MPSKHDVEVAETLPPDDAEAPVLPAGGPPVGSWDQSTTRSAEARTSMPAHPRKGRASGCPRVDVEWRRRIEDALRANAGNIAATARALGLHRTQLRRLIERHGIAVSAASGDDGDDGDDE